MGANTGAKVAALIPKIGGGVYRAKRGTAIPVDASTALTAEFVCLGAISDEGVKPTIDTNTEKVKEWDGSTLANLLTDESRSFEFTLYSVFDKDTLEFVWREENVVVTAPTTTVGTKIAVQDKGGKPEDGVLVFDMRFGDKKVRKIVPVADSTVTGEEPYVAGGLTGYTITVEALKDDAGVRVYEYSEDTDVSAV